MGYEQAKTDVKKTMREADNQAKETWRRADGEESVSDKIANTGDDIRTTLGNAGDDVRAEAVRDQPQEIDAAHGHRHASPVARPRSRRGQGAEGEC